VVGDFGEAVDDGGGVTGAKGRNACRSVDRASGFGGGAEGAHDGLDVVSRDLYLISLIQSDQRKETYINSFSLSSPSSNKSFPSLSPRTSFSNISTSPLSRSN
jgi:hypothetical protein